MYLMDGQATESSWKLSTSCTVLGCAEEECGGGDLYVSQCFSIDTFTATITHFYLQRYSCGITWGSRHRWSALSRTWNLPSRWLSSIYRTGTCGVPTCPLPTTPPPPTTFTSPNHFSTSNHLSSKFSFIWTKLTFSTYHNHWGSSISSRWWWCGLWSEHCCFWPGRTREPMKTFYCICSLALTAVM